MFSPYKGYWYFKNKTILMASFKLIIIDIWCTKVPLHWKMYSEVCFLDNVSLRFHWNLSYFCLFDNVTLRFRFNKSLFDGKLIWLMKCQWWWSRIMMPVFTIPVPGQLCSKAIMFSKELWFKLHSKGAFVLQFGSVDGLMFF
jgi:hypothetical protein